MPKISKTYRIDQKLLDRAEKLAKKNKKDFKTPNNVTAIIEEALASYLMKDDAVRIDEANK